MNWKSLEGHQVLITVEDNVSKKNGKTYSNVTFDGWQDPAYRPKRVRLRRVRRRPAGRVRTRTATSKRGEITMREITDHIVEGDLPRTSERSRSRMRPERAGLIMV